MYAELFCYGLMSQICLAYDESACRVLINAMDDTRAHYTIDAGQMPCTVIQQSIDQGMGHMPGGRVYDHILWLIYYQKVTIFI